MSQRPGGLPLKRARGAKRQGITYESKLAAAIPSASHGQWFEFEDANGHGYCQTDLIFECLDGHIGLIESKYTWTEEGHRQIEQLYKPVLEATFQRQCFGAVGAKKLLSSMPNVMIVNNIEAMLISILNGQRTCLHWIGEGQLSGIGLCRPIRHLQLVA